MANGFVHALLDSPLGQKNFQMSRLSRADRMKYATQQVMTVAQSLVSPVKGWNTRDALDAMDPGDAIQLDNWFPSAGGVQVRNGYNLYITLNFGGAGNVETLVSYPFNPAGVFLVGAAAGTLWLVATLNGPQGISLSTGYSSDAWQTSPFLSKLFFCNGVDTPQVLSSDTTVANWAFTGLTGTDPIGVINYQQRLFFWQSHSVGFWFAPLNSISGALSFFDLSAFAPDGGTLVAVTTFSHDGGNGVLDFICFIMDSGDCLIYYGNDPSNVSNFQLIGRYTIASPINIRSVCNYGAEAFITTYDDHIPLGQQLKALQRGALPPRSKIASAVQAAVSAPGNTTFGWGAIYYPAGRQLIFNVPNSDGTHNQHVQNTGITYQDAISGVVTSPWCRFNWPAYCLGLFNNSLFFGGTNGKVFQANVGTTDNGTPITAVGQQAWNAFGSPVRKRLVAFRPILEGMSYTAGISYDYDNSVVSTTGLVELVAAAIANTLWDMSPWDTSPWTTVGVSGALWNITAGSGTAISVAMDTSATVATLWLRTDFKIELGTLL
jgi:hypothetical protein